MGIFCPHLYSQYKIYTHLWAKNDHSKLVFQNTLIYQYNFAIIQIYTKI